LVGKYRKTVGNIIAYLKDKEKGIKGRGQAQAQPRHSPGTAQAQPRHSPGTAQAQPRHSPGSGQVQARTLR